MCTKEQFLQFVQITRKRNEFVDALYKLKIDAIEADDSYGELEMLFLNTNFTDEGIDWYLWYMYELPGMNEKPKAFDEESNPIKFDSDEDLWNYISSNNYLR